MNDKTQKLNEANERQGEASELSAVLSADVDCAALSFRPTCCINGFPVTGACYGKIKAGKPICMQEELCGRLYNDTGGKPAQTVCR